MKISKFNKGDLKILVPILISALYNLPGCSTGGLCHIVTDDYNLEDHHIKFVIDYCNREENKFRIEKDLCILICEYLLQVPEDDRFEVLLGCYNYGDL